MKKVFLLCAAFLMAAVPPALAAPLQGESSRAVNMRARQAALPLEFDVYRTADMPANWFKTWDGYYVTRRLDTNWVYGRVTPGGLAFTDIIVGTVDPRTVPELNGALPGDAPQVPVYVPPIP